MTAKRSDILLVGPALQVASGAYGGGMGGYTRNMQTYLATLKSEAISLRPFHHTVRGQRRGIAGSGPVRMVRDTALFAWSCIWRRPAAVHVLAQYRGALMREYAQYLICQILGIPFCYDIKAGAFEQSYANRGTLYLRLQHQIVRGAAMVFAEGRKTQKAVARDFGRDAIYFPNFVPDAEIPDTVAERLQDPQVKLLFVGYCYKDKGTQELVEGARIAAGRGLSLQLDLVGAEEAAFSSWMDMLAPVDGLLVHRHGRQDHDEVLRRMIMADVYVYPTNHPGEGHNNSINEAMMSGLVILTRPHGFLGDILSGDCALMLSAVDGADIAAALEKIDRDRPAARQLARNARRRLKEDFSSSVAQRNFAESYAMLNVIKN